MGIVGCTGNVFWSVLRGNWAVALPGLLLVANPAPTTRSGPPHVIRGYLADAQERR